MSSMRPTAVPFCSLLQRPTMLKWEYMWIYVTHEKGKQVLIANGERLEAQTYQEALNAVGKEGWELVAVIPPALLPAATQTLAQFCLKRPIVD